MGRVEGSELRTSRERMNPGEKGFLTMVDASLMAIVIIVVSFFIFQSLSAGLFYSSEPRRSEFERESVIDIQRAAISSTIGETGYLKDLGDGAKKRIVYNNITVDTAIKNYLYLKNKTIKIDISHNLTELKEDIKRQYKRCAWEISSYHFAVEAEHGLVGLFISDREEVTREGDLPDDRSAFSTHTTIGLQRVEITLYIWR
ncbi:MAG: hypothetical protein V5A88_03170 [Candidatus Thermoplasmatota archaeon]